MLIKRENPAPPAVSLKEKIGVSAALGDKIRSLFTENRDAILEIEPEEKTYYAYLPAVLELPAEPVQGIAKLLLVSSAEEAGEIEDYSRLLRPAGGEKSGLAVLGTNSNLRKENSLFSGCPGILAGPPRRIIDHLRRGDIDLSSVERVILDCPPEKDFADFFADVQFIYSKTGIKPRTLALTENPENSGLGSLLRNAKIVRKAAWMTPIGMKLALLEDFEDLAAFAVSVLSSQDHGKTPWIVLTPDEGTAAAIKRGIASLKRRRITGGQAKHFIRIREKSSEKRNIFTTVGPLLFLYPPTVDELHAAGRQSQSPRGKNEILAAFHKKDYPIFQEIQENTTVSIEKYETLNDEAALKGLIESMVERIKKDENPQELNRYRKILRKNVSIFLRSYLAAFLLKQYVEEGPGAGAKKRFGFKNSQRQEMTTLFFGLGKNRKVYPRDITQLVTQIPEIERLHIGEIKILDNYSFVEIAESQAQKVIDVLNGIEYRGRKITVNFARKRDEGREAEQAGTTV